MQQPAKVNEAGQGRDAARAFRGLRHARAWCAARAIDGVLAAPLTTQQQRFVLQTLFRGAHRHWHSRLRPLVVMPLSRLRNFYLFDDLCLEYVLDGDWDLQQQPIEPNLMRNRHYSCIFEIVREGKHYTETEQYRRIERDLETRGASERGIRSLADVHAYFGRVMEMIEAIRQGDYRTHDQLGTKPQDEIRILIDRDGEPLKFHNGHHRLAAARLFGIEKVPVYVQHVHRRWFDRCTERYSGNFVEVINQGLRDLERSWSSTESCR